MATKQLHPPPVADRLQPLYQHTGRMFQQLPDGPLSQTTDVYTDSSKTDPNEYHLTHSCRELGSSLTQHHTRQLTEIAARICRVCLHNTNGLLVNHINSWTDLHFYLQYLSDPQELWQPRLNQPTTWQHNTLTDEETGNLISGCLHHHDLISGLHSFVANHGRVGNLRDWLNSHLPTLTGLLADQWKEINVNRDRWRQYQARRAATEQLQWDPPTSSLYHQQLQLQDAAAAFEPDDPDGLLWQLHAAYCRTNTTSTDPHELVDATDIGGTEPATKSDAEQLTDTIRTYLQIANQQTQMLHTHLQTSPPHIIRSHQPSSVTHPDTWTICATLPANITVRPTFIQLVDAADAAATADDDNIGNIGPLTSLPALADLLPDDLLPTGQAPTDHQLTEANRHLHDIFDTADRQLRQPPRDDNNDRISGNPPDVGTVRRTLVATAHALTR